MFPTLRALAPTHYLVTLRRSPRGLPPRSGLTLEALGLHKLHQSVLHPFSATAAGKILKVKELVDVRNVEEEEGLRIVNGKRAEGSGLELTGRQYGSKGSA